MESTCPQCGATGPAVARFCGQCGRPLETEPGMTGRVRHSHPVGPPEGFRRCERAEDLYYRTESAWGGDRLLGTEGLSLVLWNAGYAMTEVSLEVEGLSTSGDSVFQVKHAVAALPRGQETTVEIPSYEITRPVESLRVTLESAAYE